ncbi:MAG: 16S rRNA (guanine(966)-N(2))-methyltransferase RsmD [Streptococcaceae bacterium]|jgi:16S rRNA (guanine966-N2)-methyltransferase|nr:16S rRNA (guanine(966)-N(2))-methyltransferase RsmD [Streptococcaceae bacterium]
MRIVAGKYGGRPLKSLSGATTRPTTDKIKGAVFNMLGAFFDDNECALDLYAGSGALAIEAVSRGCASAVLVEKDHGAQKVIQANLEMTKEAEKFQLMKMPAQAALSSLTEAFDLVFLDPPYAKEQMVSDIETLQTRNLLSDDAKVVCETEKSTELPNKIGKMSIWKQKTYGITKITIYSEES